LHTTIRFHPTSSGSSARIDRLDTYITLMEVIQKARTSRVLIIITAIAVISLLTESISLLKLQRGATVLADIDVTELATFLIPVFIVMTAFVSIVSETRVRRVNAELRAQTADRERAEEERARLQAALGRSEVLSALGSIVAGVAHEVRNPLFGISSTVDALEARLKRDRVDAKYERHVQILRNELDRLSRLMQDLLDYGKPQSINVSPCSVSDAVDASVAACSTIAMATGVKIITKVDGVDGWPLDRGGIDQVLRNLLENAIQHSPGGTVRIDVMRRVNIDAPQLRIQVRDEGPGFDRTQLAHVFEPFFTRRCGGTGLGLSIVERIVDAHGGSVRAANCRDGGAQITIDLPRTVQNISGAEVAGAA
jgi:signal transduction histidine kinase